MLTAVAVLFYAAAAFVPRKPWGWVVGLVTIITMIFPYCITLAFAIPLFIFWIKPQTKRLFGKQF